MRQTLNLALAVALASIVVPPPAAEAGTYTITTTTAQDTSLTRSMDRINRVTCLYYGQGVGCTQVQARREFCRRAGVGGVTTCVPGANPGDPPVCTTTPLTNSCPGAIQVDVYADVPTFLQREVVRVMREEYAPRETAEDETTRAATVAAWAQAQRNAACVAAGDVAGCLH